MATARFKFRSVARYTSPIPPTPIWAVTSYGPRRVPGVNDKFARIIRSEPGPAKAGRHVLAAFQHETSKRWHREAQRVVEAVRGDRFARHAAAVADIRAAEERRVAV